MTNKNIPDINIDEIMEKIREEVARRKRLTHQEDELLTDNDTFTHLQETAIWHFVKRVQYKLQRYPFYNYIYNVSYKFKKFIPKYKNRLEIKDILKYEDEEFIKNAYRAVLKRGPDPAGFKQYLTKLRNGQLSKIDILGRLRYSKEGRQRGIKTKGLTLRFIINTSFHIPLIGYISELLISIIRLPKILKNNQNCEALINEKVSKIIKNNIEDLSHTINEQLNKKVDIEQIEEIKMNLEDLLAKTTDHDSYIYDLQQELTLLNNKLKDKLEENHFPDSMYVAFENKFRGTIQDIKKRAEFYLTYIRIANAGTEDAPILDIGCGRGEWLSVLKENGYVAKGIDHNKFMVQRCKDMGLNVIESDAIEYLQNQEANSLGAITGFHLIEHLTLNTLMKLLKESLRVLKSKGLLIFETPNPENLRVSTCNFYTDPTHRTPLPSSLMKFLFESHGLTKIEVVNLHPYHEEFRLTGSEIAEHINKFFYGPQDYAIIGWKE